jgi:hypothetical protein
MIATIRLKQEPLGLVQTVHLPPWHLQAEQQRHREALGVEARAEVRHLVVAEMVAVTNQIQQEMGKPVVVGGVVGTTALVEVVVLGVFT